MDLGLFTVLIGVALVLVVVGLSKPSESAQALLGFFLIFVLAFVPMLGNLQYQSGETVLTNYSYNGSLIASTLEVATNTYSNYSDSSAGTYGKWLAFAGAVGFIGVLFSVGKTNWRVE